MSRIGKMPINIPSDVKIEIKGKEIKVEGPKGALVFVIHKDMDVVLEDKKLFVKRPSESKLHRSLHGTTRKILNNMVEGVVKGFTKTLELSGVGYRVAKKGNKIVLNLGFSHPVEILPTEGIELEVPSQTQIVVKGIDKQKVGAFAAYIRSFRKPEPYKGKGILYKGEQIRRKVGKKGK